MTSASALAGIRVLDLSRLAPGPMATMILADLGADVIKVEEPGGGRRARDERARRAAGATDDDRRWRAFSPLERNKRSIEVDLKQARGRDVFLRLVRDADVIVEGFRPGVVDRLRVGDGAAREANPHVIYCSISGYGQRGAHRDRVGHDLNYLAYAGALSLIGTAPDRPVVPINVIGDYAAGSLHAVSAILAALLVRERTGVGQYIDISMADGVLALLAVEVARLASTGVVPSAGSTYLTGGMAYYNVYRARDGRPLTIACNEPHFFAALCDLLEVPELAGRQFVDAEQQRANYEILQSRFALRDRAEWERLCFDRNVPFAAVRSMDEVVADEDLWGRGMFVRMTDPTFGDVTQVGSAFHLSATPPKVDSVAHQPGADTNDILKAAGFSPSEIADLRAANIVS